MPHDESDDWLFAASAAAYFFATNAAAWRTFCEELSLSPETLVAANYRGGFLKLIEEGMIERAPTAEELRSLRLATGRSDEPLSFEAALAVSALSLLSSGSLAKLKICRHCEWLFLDKSRNSSRLWCDMSVCGNRVKAKQHYRRQKMQREKTDG